MRNFVNIKTLKNNRDSDMIEYEPSDLEKKIPIITVIHLTQ